MRAKYARNVRYNLIYPWKLCLNLNKLRMLKIKIFFLFKKTALESENESSFLCSKGKKCLFRNKLHV